MLFIISCSKEEFGDVCVIGCGGGAACDDGSSPHAITLTTQIDLKVVFIFLIPFQLGCAVPRRNESKMADIDHSLGEGLWSFLRQIVPDAAVNVPVLIFA